jgi:hypothetical protein
MNGQLILEAARQLLLEADKPSLAKSMLNNAIGMGGTFAAFNAGLGYAQSKHDLAGPAAMAGLYGAGLGAAIGAAKYLYYKNKKDKDKMDKMIHQYNSTNAPTNGVVDAAIAAPLAGAAGYALG